MKYGEKFIMKSKPLKNPLISIVLPVYNGQRFLPEAIQSCLNQTYTNFELIIVNDCSTDNSLSIAEKYSKEDSRINIISNQRNLKLPASLNIGHQCAGGSFITWISDDNCFKNNAIENLLAYLENNNVDIVYSDYELIDESGKFLKNVDIKNNSILTGNSIGASFLYKREVFEKNSGYAEHLHLTEDYDFWLRSSQHSSFFHIEKNLYQYRSHGKSMTAKINLEKPVNEEFAMKLELTYKSFFESFSYINAKRYSTLFRNLHIHQETNTLYLLEIYSEIMSSIARISHECKSIDFQMFKQEFDKRIRSTILYIESNQIPKVLIRIGYYQPEILI